MHITDEPIAVTLSSEDVAAAARNHHGLTYKGFGVLSGNATSSLLLDYKAEHPEVYWRLIETLFGGERPLMNLIKVEMGNDRNNSTGPNAATMRDRDDYPNVLREPGFQLAADARRFQPDVHVSILRWCAPTWVRTNDDVYHWYKNTILACYRQFGFMIDTVNPDVNERTADLQWVSEFARRVRHDEEGFIGAGPDDPNAGWSDDTERELFHRIRVITSDEEITGTFGPDLIGNEAYRSVIDIAAYHYSVDDDAARSFTRLAEEYDKEIWNSEAQAVFSNSADRPNNTNGHGLGDGRVGTGIGGPGGPLEMANTIIKGFVESRRTCTIYQPAIGSCYDHMEYASKELISARDPWSGWIYYDAGCAVLAHFASFADLGWEHGAESEMNGSASPSAGDVWRAIPQASDCRVGGRNPVNGARHGEPSYVTLAAPDGSDMSVVIVNDSALPRTYRVAVDASLGAAGRPLRVWRTASAQPGEWYGAGWLRDSGYVIPERDGGLTVATVTVDPWTMITVTTLVDVCPTSLPSTAEHSRAVLDVDPDGGVMYADDFRYADEPPVEVSCADGVRAYPYVDARGGDGGAVPRYTTDTNGAFEVVPDESRGRALRQQIDRNHAGDAWIEGDPRTAIGDMRWLDYQVSVDVCFEEYVGRAPYALVGAREMGGSKFTQHICAYDFTIQADGVFLLRRFGEEKVRGHLADLRAAASAAGTCPFRPGAGVWNTVALRVAGGDIAASVNGAVVAVWHDDAPQSSGRVNLGTSFNRVRFSDLRVERVDARPPYYAEFIDDMHMRSWDDSSTPVVEYEGTWTHENGQSMFTYLRTISKTNRRGSRLTYRFSGDGLDIFGPSDGGAALDVSVDGRVVGLGMPTMATDGALRTMFRIDGLGPGVHTVNIGLANDREWAVDALGVIPDMNEAAGMEEHERE